MSTHTWPVRNLLTVASRCAAVRSACSTSARSPSYTSAWKSCIARSTDCTKMSTGGRSPSRTIWRTTCVLAVLAPAEDERLLYRVRRRVLLAHNHLDRLPQHRVHQVLDRGGHRRREEAALHRRAIARGEHLVALLEEPELEQLVRLVQHQVLATASVHVSEHGGNMCERASPQV